jgi:[acyl-carrier-protein] S-malonyltransferase
MAPAADVMANALAEATIRPPRPPLVANVTAEAADDPDTIRRLLVAQVTAMVRWRESVLMMRDHGVDTLVELGAGKVLTGLTRRIDRELTGIAVGTPAEIEALIKSL